MPLLKRIKESLLSWKRIVTLSSGKEKQSKLELRKKSGGDLPKGQRAAGTWEWIEGRL
jgi:hypothetical protein